MNETEALMGNLSAGVERERKRESCFTGQELKHLTQVKSQMVRKIREENGVSWTGNVETLSWGTFTP